MTNEEKVDYTKLPIGTILHTSWGYDMTHNDYCVVLKNTGKTLLCQMVHHKNVSGNDGFTGTEVPDKDGKAGNPFRVRIVHSKKYNHTSLSGSYPYCATCGDGKSTSMKEGHWRIWDGHANYYNYMD